MPGVAAFLTAQHRGKIMARDYESATHRSSVDVEVPSTSSTPPRTAMGRQPRGLEPPASLRPRWSRERLVYKYIVLLSHGG